MAIVQNPITGRTRGKFASAVFSKQFGKNTMRSKPISVKNPRTKLQRKQRSKFAIMVELARKFLSFIRLGFKQSAIGMSEFNAFVQTNIFIAISGTYPDFAIDYTKIVVSKGTLTGAVGTSALAEAEKKVTVNWSDNTGSCDALAEDKALIVLLNPESKNVVASTEDKTREDETMEFTVPDAWVGDEVHVYIGFSNDKGDKVADSKYVGAVTILE